MKFLIFSFLLFCIQPLFAQSASDQVLQKTNQDKLLQLAEQYNKEAAYRFNKAKRFAKEKQIPLTIDLPDGSFASLVELDTFGFPKYLQTNNLSAAISTNTHLVLDSNLLGYRLDGSNMIIGEWDAGGVRLSHKELIGRVTQIDQPDTTHDHAQHVAGTMMATGLNPIAKGMAPMAHLWAHDWFNDEGEMAVAAANGLLISQHSYGWITGWYQNPDMGTYWYGNQYIDDYEDANFGRYDEHARHWDEIAYNAPYYLICKSAGNDRGDFSSGSHYVRDSSGSWVTSSAARDKDGGQNGYDCIGHNGNAKNILTIGAVEDLLNYQTASDVTMTSFSSWGPSDDGRIKPDLVGNGYSVYSTSHGSDSAYSVKSGTSMSGPNVAGSLLLLQEAYQRKTGNFMRAASLKGLAIHTCREAGLHEGPDYRFGWGILDTWKAAQLINDDRSRIDELHLSDGDTLYYRFYNNGQSFLKVTLSWTDVPDSTITFSLNDRTPKLVNDLDIQILDPKGTIHLPYCLDPNNPDKTAFRSVNSLDNVEQIPINFPSSGLYTIMITHKHQLDDIQALSLIVEGVDSKPDLCFEQTTFYHSELDSSISEAILTQSIGDTLLTLGRYKGRYIMGSFSKPYTNNWQYFICQSVQDSVLSWLEIICDSSIQFKDMIWQDENVYLSGSLVNQLQLGSQIINGSGNPNGFITKMQLNGYLNWILLNQSLQSSTDKLAFNGDELFIAGQYSGPLQLSSMNISGPLSNNIFTGILDTSGQVLELGNIYTDSSDELIDMTLIEGNMFLALNTEDTLQFNGQEIYTPKHSIFVQIDDQLMIKNAINFNVTDSFRIASLSQHKDQLLVHAHTFGSFEFANQNYNGNLLNQFGLFSFTKTLAPLWYTGVSSTGSIMVGPKKSSNDFSLIHIKPSSDLYFNDSLHALNSGQSYLIGIDNMGHIFHYQHLTTDGFSSLQSIQINDSTVIVSLNARDSIMATSTSTLQTSTDLVRIQFDLWPSIDLDLGSDIYVACLDTVPLQANIHVGITNYVWSSSNFIADSSQLSTFGIVNQSGYFAFHAYNGCGQVTSDNFLVEVSDSLGMFLEIGPDTLIQCNDSLLTSPIFSGPGPLTYLWSPSHGVADINQAFTKISPQFSNIQYTLRMINSCGGQISDQFKVDVEKPDLQAVLLQDTSLICGDSVWVDLNVSGSTNLSYQWIPSSFVSDPQTIPTYIYPISSRNYTLRILGGCGSVINRDIQIDIDSLIVPIQNTNDSLQSTELFDSYQWMLNGQDIPMADQSSLVMSDTGYYQLRGMNANGCVGLSSPFYFYPNSTNLIQSEWINVFPNPVSNQVTIETYLPNFKYSVFDMLGRQLIDGRSSTHTKTLSISQLTAGVYNLVITADQFSKTKRIHKLK